MSRIVSLIILIVIVLAVGALVFKVMAGFLLPMFLAVVLVVIFRPLHRWYTDKFKGRVRVAAAATTLTVILIVLVPILWVLILATADAVSFFASFDTGKLQDEIARVRASLKLELPSELAALEKQLDVTAEQSKFGAPPKNLAEVESAIDELKQVLQRQVPPPDAGDEEADDADAADQRSAVEFLNDELDGMMRELNPDRPDESEAEDREQVTNRVQGARNTYYELRTLAIRVLAPTLEPLPLNIDLVANDRTRAWLTVQANPSNEQIDEMRTALVTRFGPQSLGPLALSTGQYLGGVLGKFLLGLFVMVISLYYFFADGPGMISSVMRLSPLDDKYEEQMLLEFDKISRAVVMATLLSAVVQGILGGIGYLLTGLDSLFLLTVLTMFFAMVPFVGAAAVWVPCSLYLLIVQQEVGWAIFLAVWGAVVVSMSDNIVKPLILHGQSNLHPLLALLSVIGGVQALGPIGIFVGPMVVSFMQAVLNMFQSELAEFGKKATA